ncbi:hypothetical protein DYBT9275_02492 [Dyadobacter sp. CECT 9275]|uniref:C1q domain-containing protein n=1 Tax=Dyadobacter helix TaxID=2822344 RepID=A0A916N5Y7_9BACT|nr:hypothetical protein [Dyadobacter sp. CECT 9275]CAG5000585.1 hypothetical protein DYBT9275_02492 [Dyadobacter sp. CECT 9275]
MKITRTLAKAILASAMLFASSNLFAQVKIGTNPTNIEPASNLEVEASTADRKVKVNKTTGQLTIKDGTEGIGRILTSDAVGGASWTLETSAFRARRTSTQGITSSLTDFFNVNLEKVNFDQDGGLTMGAASGFTVKKPGTYIFNANISFQANSPTAASVAIFKNGVLLKNSGVTVNSKENYAFEISIIDIATTGDFYELRANNNTGGMFIFSGDFSGSRMR